MRGRITGLPQHGGAYIEVSQRAVALATASDGQLAEQVAQILSRSQAERAEQSDELDKVQLRFVHYGSGARFHLPRCLQPTRHSRSILILVSGDAQ